MDGRMAGFYPSGFEILFLIRLRETGMMPRKEAMICCGTRWIWPGWFCWKSRYLVSGESNTK